MRIDVLARNWCGPSGGPNGMAIAASFFAHTLAELGHQVRRLEQLDGVDADLIITTVAPTWRRTVEAITAAGARDRLVYWHHGGGVPDGHGCILAAPPAIPSSEDWLRHVVLPPSSWAAEAGGVCTGREIVVAGAGAAKGGHISLAVARQCPDLFWYVLQSRSAPADREPWRVLPNAEIASGIVSPEHFLARARAILSPTRFEVHPLLLLEAAVRGIPVVCTDMISTRCATGGAAIYVPMNAPASEWEAALRAALELPMGYPKLELRPYREVVSEALYRMQGARAAA